MQSRRDLLKFFGAGTIIVPAAGAAPLAKLIETPRVELVEPQVVRILDLSNVKNVTMTFEALDGSLHAFRSSNIYGKGRIVSRDRLEFDIKLSKVDRNTSPAIWNEVGNIVGGGSL